MYIASPSIANPAVTIPSVQTVPALSTVPTTVNTHTPVGTPLLTTVHPETHDDSFADGAILFVGLFVIMLVLFFLLRKSPNPLPSSTVHIVSEEPETPQTVAYPYPVAYPYGYGYGYGGGYGYPWRPWHPWRPDHPWTPHPEPDIPHVLPHSTVSTVRAGAIRGGRR